MRNLFLVSVAGAALVLGVRPAIAQSANAVVVERATDAIRQHPQFSIFDDVQAAIANGSLILTGRVTTASKREQIAEHVARVTEGKVTNDIRVLPVSADDQRLRAEVANAIYNHPALWRYAELAHPPIHIVIEHQRITLIGQVGSPGDRMLAYSLAQVPGAASVTNELRVTAR